MNLILIRGQTSTGKTTLARRLSKDLGITLHSADDWKEREKFDLPGFKHTPRNLYMAEQLSRQALLSSIEAAVRKDEDLLVEGMLRPSLEKKIMSRVNDTTNIIELLLTAKGFVAYRRFVYRNESGNRHPGHHDRIWYLNTWLEGASNHLGLPWVRPLGFSHHVLQVDTTEFDSLDYDKIRAFIVDSCRV